jgi:hypothetical protein
MIRPAIIFVFAATIILLSACESDQEQRPHSRPHQFGYGSETQTVVGPGASDDRTPSAPEEATPDNGGPIAPPPPPPPTSPEPNPGPAASGTTSASGTVKHDYPYAQPVAGKPGFVTSPYAPYSGYVDVRGFPPGTEVKDPYTQKVFLVP